MTHVTCRLTAKNRDQLRNPTLGNRVWAAFAFYTLFLHHAWLQGSVIWADDVAHRLVPVLMTLNDREGRRKPVCRVVQVQSVERFATDTARRAVPLRQLGVLSAHAVHPLW